jgi:hypothetical protein
VPSDEIYLPADTERSWEIYDDIHNSYPNAIVIGGWASWLHNKAAKSHDIDIIVTSAELDDMRQALDLTENSHFGSPKWRGTYDGIHLDIYVTYRSRLGTRLQLPVEHLVKHRLDIGATRRSTRKRCSSRRPRPGWTVPTPCQGRRTLGI